MKDNEFKIGSCYKTKRELSPDEFYIPENSNVLYLGIEYIPFNGASVKYIKFLYMGKFYHFSTFMSLDAWLKVLDNPTTTE